MVLKRAASRATSKCPPGVLCLSSQLVFFLLAALIIGIIVIVALKDNARFHEPQQQQPQQQPQQQQKPIHISVNANAEGGDDRYTMAPQPYRSWLREPEYPPRGSIASIPVGIHTRGLPDKFQSMGIITTPDGDVLPLYGRRSNYSNDRWNYYTRTDTYNPVPLPVTFQKKDCMEDMGCNEVFDGDSLTSATGKTGQVKIYKMDGPKYIPGLYPM
jgi:hypothetical protein